MSSGMLRRVVLVRTDVSDEPNASFIKVLGSSETAVLTRAIRRNIPETILHSHRREPLEALGSSETSVLTRAIRCNIPEDTILHSHHRENLKSYTVLFLVHLFLTTC
jgi:hypothetical protein